MIGSPPIRFLRRRLFGIDDLIGSLMTHRRANAPTYWMWNLMRARQTWPLFLHESNFLDSPTQFAGHHGLRSSPPSVIHLWQARPPENERRRERDDMPRVNSRPPSAKAAGFTCFRWISKTTLTTALALWFDIFWKTHIAKTWMTTSFRFLRQYRGCSNRATPRFIFACAFATQKHL